MAYRTHPRYQARVERRRQPRDLSTAARPEERWEAQPVLAALHEMHNARPQALWREVVARPGRQGGV
jgi:hypothetical protein